MNQGNLVLYIILGALLALVLSYFLYVYKKNKKQKTPYFLLLLRFLSLLALLLLLINPSKEIEQLTEIKPKLVVAVDNSTSIKHIKATNTVENIVESVKNNTLLNEKFDVDYFSFGVDFHTLDSLSFSSPQTNHSVLLNQIKALYHKSPVLLVTDGNQTTGNNYSYFSSDNQIFPIVVGDTTHYKDLAITQLNVNPYAFLDNKFPVEIFVNYKGDTPIKTQVSIYRSKQKVFSKKIKLSQQTTSTHISTLLPAEQVGQHYYSVKVEALKDENNTRNNRKDFSIEVVDQQTQVLLLSSFIHPDLGAIKKSIESNKQRKVTIKTIDETLNLSDYQLVILYQPTASFESVYKEILEQNTNTILITGTHTDWAFLNGIQKDFQKNMSSQTELYQAVYNPVFSEFVTKDIEFEGLPPLKDYFGKLTFSLPYQTLLFQKIGSTVLDNPLLVTYHRDNSKQAILFGEDIWRWRMLSAVETKSFAEFDAFWNSIVQFTAVSKKANQLYLDYDKMVYSNQEQVIHASYVDQNYQIDTQAVIWLILTDKTTNKTEKLPFSLYGTTYQVVLPDLHQGDYAFKVEVEGKTSKIFGHFKVLDYNVEQQFLTANKVDLEHLANASGGALGYVDKLDKTLNQLINSESYKTIQTAKKQTKALIDWYWLLGLIILSLSVEWLIRKYRGMV